MARALANKAMVLLKNDGTLPLRTGAIRIAVVGPLADQTKISARKLHGHADAYRIGARRTQGRISRGPNHLCSRNAISA